MAQFEKWFTVDLMNTIGHVQDIGTLMFTGDNKSHKIGVKLLNNRVPQNVIGSVVGLIIRHGDCQTVVQNGDKEDNKAWIELPESALSIPGRITISLRIINGQEKTIVLAVSADVKVSTTDAIVDPGHVVPDISDIVALYDEMQEATEAAEAASTKAVRYDAAQTLTDAQKTQARGNIGAAGEQDVADLRATVDYALIKSDPVDFTSLQTIGRNISPSTSKWSDANAPQAYMLDVPEKVYGITITANASSEASVAFLRTNDTTLNQTPNYATGHNARIVIAAGTSQTFTIPDDCEYIFILKVSGAQQIDRMPQSVSFQAIQKFPEIDTTLSVRGSAADAKATGDKIDFEIDRLWNGESGQETYTKAQFLEKYPKYSTNTLYSAADSTIGKTFPSEIATTTNGGAYAILIDITGIQSITYPKYKNTSGRGCLVLNESYIITKNLPCLSDDTGTMATVTFGSGDKYFLFGANSGLASLDWTITLQGAPTKGLNDLAEDLSEFGDDIEALNEGIAENKNNISKIMQGGLFPAPKLNAEIVGFLCYGQSWTMGYDSDAIVSTQRYDNLMLNTGLKNNPATDLVITGSSFSPLVEATTFSSVAQTTKCGQTPCTAQTDIIKQLLLAENGLSSTDAEYHLFSAAPGMGDKSLEELAYGTTYYQRLIDVVTAANTIARAQGKVFVVPAISWAQGKAATGDATYYDQLEELRAHLDTDIKAITGQTIPVKLIVWQAVFGNTTPKRFYDRYVYASEKYEHIICSGTYYHLNHKANNNLHLTALSQDWLGTQFGIAYKRTIIDGEKFIPLKPKKVEVYGNIAYLDFFVPVKPLVFDTTLVASITNYGFQIFDNSDTEKTISSVSIIAPNRVKIVCASNIAATDHIVYGGNGGTDYSPTTGKRGNLRDSQNIVYTNHAETDLHCYNWCVVFDKTIAELTQSN